MTSTQIRQQFLDFFASKGHHIVPSAPMVVQGDPTLMFINSGMAPFKDIFLGAAPVKYPRIADTQKCLRVSGKHNDLEDVGHDTYHHTMFEMLGNWSFGDYFKTEAIAWAWELLTEVYKIPKDRLYVTVFEGDVKENLAADSEAKTLWLKYIAEDRILNGNKKDNFWEMGDTGPCGPCSEIHIDLRPDSERNAVDGKTLVNADHPQVIEVWNNVFMQFERKANGSLVDLPARHVDTGMGFERLCMALQGKTSNYDTDVFQPMIQHISKASGIDYIQNDQTGEKSSGSNIAMRVMADHIRTIAFAIADGQLPSNVKAGYVIRRILRRAVRYGYSNLGFREPFLHTLVPILAEQMGLFFPEIAAQKDFVAKVIMEEEASFLRTLANGIERFENYTADKKAIEGAFAFELYDTFGFPIDLTQLMAREKGITVDMDGFNENLLAQKTRSRAATSIETEDWVMLQTEDTTEFVGYDKLECSTEIVKYRKVKAKDKTLFQLVLSYTPFYAESGGQIGDTGQLIDSEGNITHIIDTKKENGLPVHLVDTLPLDVNSDFTACVNNTRRTAISNNHSATHLMHSALRQVLGTHVAQKGSLVNDEALRFDFSHFSKVTDEQIAEVETIVNKRIRENIFLQELRNVPFQEAIDGGVTALFGEKYGDFVRVITYDKEYSSELCGGTHVPATGQIGLFKLMAESSVAAGVRRVEAITAEKAMQWAYEQADMVKQLKTTFKNEDVLKAATNLQDENAKLKREIEILLNEKAKGLKNDLKAKIKAKDGINLIAEIIDLSSAEAIKNLAYELKNEVDNLVLVLGNENDGKPMLTVMIAENLVKDKNLNAGNIIRKLAKHIQGGGGGQAFYATAGGKDMSGLGKAVEAAGSIG